MAGQNNGGNGSGLTDVAKGIKKVAELAKAGAQAAAGNWLPLIKILIPFLIFVVFGVFIFTVLFVSWIFAPKDDGKTSFESPKNIITEEFKQGIIGVVTDAYNEANKNYLETINNWYEEDKAAYDTTTITIVNTLEDTTVMNSEIYKVYAMFSVYKDREFAIKRAKNPNLKMEDEAALYDINDLKKMLKNKYNKLLICEVYRNEGSYQPQKWDSESQRWVEDESKSPVTYCHFTYKIVPQPIDEVGPFIFDLKDLTNSDDPDIPSEARINEIEMAATKAKSIEEIFDGTLSEYSGTESEFGLSANSTYVGAADYSTFIENYTVQNVNFTVNEKMSVPLGSGYSYLGSDKADFGWRIHPIKKEMKFHTGIDIGAPTGVPIYSLANGVVVKTGYNDGYGNFVVVYHGEIDGAHYFTTYNHMHEAAYVQEGQQVTSATKLGIVGSTGLATGPHLHFEIRVGIKEGNSYKFVFKDPLPFLNIE